MVQFLLGSLVMNEIYWKMLTEGQQRRCKFEFVSKGFTSGTFTMLEAVRQYWKALAIQMFTYSINLLQMFGRSKMKHFLRST